MPGIVNPNLRASLLAEGEELFKERTRLEARLVALDNLHNCMIEAAALNEINQQRALDRAHVSARPRIERTFHETEYLPRYRKLQMFD